MNYEPVLSNYTRNCMPIDKFDDWSYMFSNVESTRPKQATTYTIITSIFLYNILYVVMIH